MTNFVIFSIPRSGTSWLTTSLRNHPDILCHGEALLPRHIPKHLHGSARAVFSAEHVERQPVEYVRQLFEYRDGHSAVGFKVFQGHSPDVHEILLNDESISKIILKRENHLASYSSLLIAKDTGQWSTSNPDARKEAKAHFEAKRFDKFCRRADDYFAFVSENCRGPRLDITYEDHIMAQNLTGVIEFLGADTSVELHSDKVKQLSRDVVARFDNPEEVKQWLDATGRSSWQSE